MTALIKRQIWDAIVDGTIYSCPSLLSSFYAIFFADLKKYKFTYHFGFPALHSSHPWKSDSDDGGQPKKLAPLESLALYEAVQTWRYSVDPRQHGFFLAKRDHWASDENDGQATHASREETDENSEKTRREQRRQSETPKTSDLPFRWVVGSLASYETGFFTNVDPTDCFVCFADPSTYAENPSWMLRNLLVLVRQRWRLNEVHVLCYRDKHARRETPASLILNLTSVSAEQAQEASDSSMPKVTGWERNDQNKLNSRTVNLAEYLDPAHLASQSVDLNLKLMKWRIAPELDLNTISQTKCLLLGAGTLGSYVSRNLLGWGVRKITFVDNGRVSYSNPVRQPLFEFSDCGGGGRFKAERAAEKLKEIYPGVEAESYVLGVPMAGHPLIDEDKVKREFDTLKRLIDEHDVIFLLLDTRESRWLPTLMGKAAGKIVMNAALGFDTYVVLRQGAKRGIHERGQEQQEGQGQAEELGCYFCNDVVAPADVSQCSPVRFWHFHPLTLANTYALQSVKDQTLDQQCTVTRPGIAAIASALLVELLMSLLQHPLRALAPAPSSRNAERSPLSHPLGLIPHSIRGFLSTFDNMLIKGPAYDCCSACSPRLLEGYEMEGWEFVKKCLAEKGFVEKISGLAEVQKKAEEVAATLDWSEDEADEGGLDEEGELL